MERRQVFDLPPMRVRVTEHQLVARRCGCGATTCGDAPEGVTAPVGLRAADHRDRALPVCRAVPVQETHRGRAGRAVRHSGLRGHRGGDDHPGASASSAPQPPHGPGSWRSVSSGSATCASVDPGCPLLPARLASALAAQRLWSRLGERRVRRRWLRRVLRILPQPGGQLSNPSLQRLDHRPELRVLSGKLLIGRTQTSGHHPNDTQHGTKINQPRRRPDQLRCVLVV